MNKTKLYYSPKDNYLFLVTPNKGETIVRHEQGVFLYTFKIELINFENYTLLDEDFYSIGDSHDCINDAHKYMNGGNN